MLPCCYCAAVAQLFDQCQITARSRSQPFRFPYNSMPSKRMNVDLKTWTRRGGTCRGLGLSCKVQYSIQYPHRWQLLEKGPNAGHGVVQVLWNEN